MSGASFYGSVGASYPTVYNVAGAQPISLIGVKVDSVFSISGAWNGCYV